MNNERMIHVDLRIPLKLSHKIGLLASLKGTNKTKVINQILEEAIEQYLPAYILKQVNSEDK